MKVLIVEDEPALGSAVQEYVRRAGHVVDWFGTLHDARAALAVSAYDFVILDLGLPDGNGLDLLREIRRAHSPVAVLVTTAFDQISDRIEGLSRGADDYIVKPYDLDELIARIDAVARRYIALAPNEIRVGAVTVDLARGNVSRDGNVIELTRREWALIELLARRPGAICSREQIEDALYSLGEEIESNAIEVFVSRVRKKIGAAVIHTARGRGYRFGDSSGV